ncbi:MAG TPA: glycoside hydrolase family 3 C-terminal domain-containing protein [Longimicrobiaceae bacterium]|nr:glycoside hydrolase family 3 C-terminal domain-containing protein [Longimicrobiaceae bacterium]
MSNFGGRGRRIAVVAAAVAGLAGAQAAVAGAQAAWAPASSNDPAVERRVDSLMAKLTADEKLALLGGVNFFDVPGNARVGLPVLGTADSPFGVRADGPSTVYPGGIGLAATWDTALAERIGAQVGRDARARGKQYSLGPAVDIYRAPQNGRNFEYFGEDPWLASRMAVGYIRGLQSQGVSATIKHFMGNNSEFARNTSDSRIDERALREIYLPAYEAAVKEADVGAIMPSYNLTNGTYMTANRRLLTDVAKGEWGFRGVMMSDWGAVHSALGAANGGTDLEMPGPRHFDPDSLRALLKSGAVTQATIDDKVRRLLRNEVRFGWLDRPLSDPSIPRYNQEGRAAALQGAREAMVLLKNDGSLLPLDRDRVKTVAVIGPNADPAVILGGGSATVPPFHAVSTLEGISDFLGTGARVLNARGIPSLARAAAMSPFTTAPSGGKPGVTLESFGNADLTGAPTATRVERAISIGRPFDLAALFSDEGGLDVSATGGAQSAPGMRWTGYYTPKAAGPQDFFVQQGGFGGSGARLFVDGKKVIDSWDAATAMVGEATVQLDATPHKIVLEYHSAGGFGGPFVRAGVVPQSAWVDPAALQLAKRADAVVLAVGFDPHSESEGWDRTFGLPPGQDALIRAVSAANPHTIVVINSGGAVDMTGWLDGVPALVQEWYPGELGGTALAEILFGAVNPSGHLPATFEKRWEDNPVHDSYYPTPGTLEIPYREGVFVGYRGYDHNHVQPLFPFGYGLSYTTFGYANPAVTPDAGSTAANPRYTVSFDVTNTGPRPGAAVAEVYVSDAGARLPRPEKELKGFVRVMLQPGQTQRVTVPLDLRSLAYYDVQGKQWRADAGTYTIRIGGSSADLPISAPLRLQRTATRPVGQH